MDVHCCHELSLPALGSCDLRVQPTRFPSQPLAHRQHPFWGRSPLVAVRVPVLLGRRALPLAQRLAWAPERWHLFCQESCQSIQTSWLERPMTPQGHQRLQGVALDLLFRVVISLGRVRPLWCLLSFSLFQSLFSGDFWEIERPTEVRCSTLNQPKTSDGSLGEPRATSTLAPVSPVGNDLATTFCLENCPEAFLG